ncbi:MAG: copper transporter [Nocardioidaceae bacterium]|nr:copper transporter [Nocardioidaceae bacterium]
MSWLRRHVWTILAICVALAAGVALGAGPLQRDEGDRNTAGRRGDQAIAAPLDDDPFREALTLTATEALVGAKLEGVVITLVVLPEVDDNLVEGVASVIEQAGGSLAATVRIDEAFTDPGSKAYVDSVATSSAKGVQDVSGIPVDDTYELISGLVARAYVTGDDGSAPVLDEVATRIDSELQGANLVEVEGDPLRSGALVVVLAHGADGTDDLSAATNLIETKLITALAKTADAVLLATTPAASSRAGLLAALADVEAVAGADNLASLNVIGSAAGRVASVYALLAVTSGQAGQYGIVDGEVVLPPGLSLPPQ